MEVRCQFQDQAALAQGSIPGTHWRGDCVGPRVGLNAVRMRKIPCPDGNQTRSSSPQPSQNTD